MVADNQTQIFDADQHYYETIDAFTRYLPAAWQDRAVRVIAIDGRVRLLCGNHINQTLANPTYDPIVKPGALAGYFRGNVEGKTLQEYLKEREPIPSYYRNPADRLKKLDEQGIDRVWMLPTTAMTIEEDLKEDPSACAVAFEAFNRWLLDDWGFNYKDRIFSPPYLMMGDPERAVSEVEWALGQGARFFVVRASGVLTETGWRSPGDPLFDPIWARINEAGAVVVPHAGEVGSHGLERFNKVHKSNGIAEPPPPLQIVFGHRRPIENYLASLVCDLVFERFPDVRVASIENGADYLPLLLRGLKRAGSQRPGYFKNDPVETFKRHVWVAPFWEDDLAEAVAMIGADRVLFGSDWPHPEGLAEPRQFLKLAAELDDPVAQHKIVYANAAELAGVT
jgi:predicted TIM-barrel fold metal-dependent hydrolase